MNLNERCAICGAKTKLSGKTTRYRKWCVECYSAGLVRKLLGDTARTEIQRPRQLRDTGMRIHEGKDLLVHADGTEETPIPKTICFPDYWFENEKVKDHSLIIKVMERR